jgi:hypothetical protein
MPPLRIKFKWELFSSPDLEETKQKALELGWAENKVQVRQVGGYYMIEPFDNCGCSQIIPYKENTNVVY